MVHRFTNFPTFNVRPLMDSSHQVGLANSPYHNKNDVAFIQERHFRKNEKVNIVGYSFSYDYYHSGDRIMKL